jgi:hypothetical protein
MASTMPLGITQLGYYKENRKPSSGIPSVDCSGSFYLMPCITADNSVLTFVRWAERFLAFMGHQPIFPRDRSSQILCRWRRGGFYIVLPPRLNGTSSSKKSLMISHKPFARKNRNRAFGIEVQPMGLVKDCVNRTRHWFRKRTVLNKIRVLVFDEDAAGSELLRSALLQESAAFVDETQSVASALEMHRRTPYHVILAGIQTGRGCV